MFDWLFEGRQSVYLILGALAILVAALWARSGFVVFREKDSGTSKRQLDWTPLVLGVLVLFGLVYFLLDRLVETRREQITRKLQAMAGAVKKHDSDGIFTHISNQFRFQGLDKAGFRSYVEDVFRNGWVDDLVVWEVAFPDLDSGKVDFRAKPKGGRIGEEYFFLVRGEFVRDPDGQWRLATFTIYRPDIDTNQPVQIPGLP